MPRRRKGRPQKKERPPETAPRPWHLTASAGPNKEEESDPQEMIDEIESLVSELENVKGELENVTYPSMM